MSIKRQLFLSIGFLSLLLSGCAETGVASSPSNGASDSSFFEEPGVREGEGILPSSLVLANMDDYRENDNLPSLGEQRVLVVPCRFEGEEEFTSADLERLGKAFFDAELSSNLDCYFSVSEFYARSSYGKLKLTGTVTDVVEIPYTVEEAERLSNYLPGLPAEILYEESGLPASFFQDFDRNDDGYVDAVYFVYSTPMDERSSNFWAWTATFDAEANPDKPTFRRHVWCSLSSSTSDLYAIDAHTYVHETGHLLGLRDYYPSDNSNLSLGGHSMMDYNISDHDPYSKMLLGWVDPRYYEFEEGSSIEVTLEDFQRNGDVILLRDGWSHSALDEYLLLEYYVPGGLNAPDAEKQYLPRPLGFTEEGIKLYHVDARVARLLLSGDRYEFDQYVDDLPEIKEENAFYLIGANANNSDSYTDASRAGRYKEISLVENKEINYLQSGSSADDDSLFKEGDAFDSSDSAYLTNGLFNNREEIGFSFEVLSLDGEKATLSISFGKESL